MMEICHVPRRWRPKFQHTGGAAIRWKDNGLRVMGSHRRMESMRKLGPGSWNETTQAKNSEAQVQY